MKNDFKAKFQKCYDDLYQEFSNVNLIELNQNEGAIISCNITARIWYDQRGELYACLEYENENFLLEEFLDAAYGMHGGFYIFSTSESEVAIFIKKIFDLLVEKVFIIKNSDELKGIITKIKEKRIQDEEAYLFEQIEESAVQAFREKRYEEVIKLYKSVPNLKIIQKKRLHIAEEFLLKGNGKE